LKYLKSRARFFVYWVKFLNSFLYDLTRFVKYSNIEYREFENTDKLIAKIVSLYHVVEKGLSLEHPRTGFGMPRIEMLVRCISIYSRRVPESGWNIHVVSAIWVLDEYLRFNQKRNLSIPLLETFLSKHSDFLGSNVSKGGTKKIDIDAITCAEPPSFDSVVAFRSSIRHFGTEKLEISSVDSAIALSQNSPSTCNRQSTRILRTSDRESIEKVLLLQKGANGFSEGITCLLIVCTDLACYQGDGDRHSGIIDASLFGMTLIHSLTRFRIASIPLNWSKSYSEDIKLRKLINIPNSYNVLFLIGLGSFKEGIQVPVSTKSDIMDICEDVLLKDN
jgi:hypothetical protein